MRAKRFAWITAGTFVLLAVAASPGFGAQVKERIAIRVVGLNSNIFEGTVRTGPRSVATPSGGAHECNGLNNGSNATPGPTPTTALAVAAAKAGFTFDGVWESPFDDFTITRIGEFSESSTEFWGLLVNYQFTPTGGCQTEVHAGDEVEWIYNAFNDVHFLKLTKLSKNTVEVTEGATGVPISGATVGPDENEAGPTTNENGEATLLFANRGPHRVIATQANSAPSNAVILR
jgi:hypothetical protein